MPIGTGAIQLQGVPAEPFIIDPAQFFAMTRKNEHHVEVQPLPTLGTGWQKQLPQTGIISRMVTTFVGELVVASAASTSSNRWPYGLLDRFNLSANGQNNLWNVDGLDLHTRRGCRFPAYEEAVDVFPGSVGGGDTIAVGTHPIYLTWETDIAADDTSLVGSLYAQSGATNLTVDRGVARMDQLMSALPGNCTLTGEFHTEITRFSIPRSAAEGAPLVIPDLTRLHGVNAIETQFSATGPVRTELVRSAGQLHRLFVSLDRGANARLSALPSAAAANKIDAIRMEYGANERPLDYDPAARLLSRNNDWYGAPAPYDRLVIDNVRENAPRDVMLLQGVTDLVTIVTVNSGVTVSAGRVRHVQETLF